MLFQPPEPQIVTAFEERVFKEAIKLKCEASRCPNFLLLVSLWEEISYMDETEERLFEDTEKIATSIRRLSREQLHLSAFILHA